MIGFLAPGASADQGANVVVAQHRTTGRPRGVTAADASAITCTLAIQNPHNSKHVSGTVNVVATWTCDAPVSSLSMAVALYFEGAPVRRATFRNAGQPSLQGNAAFPCAPGNWQGRAVGTVVFPPTYDPPSATLNVVSPVVPLGCP
jgi:hypothetical protein